jgi:cytochrome c-type biogenesis protein CcmH/NrfF
LWRSIRLSLLTGAILVSLALAIDPDSQRMESLSAKLRCSCGCEDILAECSHAKCETKRSLKNELADAIHQGQTDEQILDLMGTRHGATILLTPAFKGFNTLLWIVPIALGLFGFALVLFRRLWSKRLPTDRAE